MTLITARPFETPRLNLTPMTVSDAEEMTDTLSDSDLYIHIGGTPPTFEELRTRYQRQSTGHSPDGSQAWLNWIIRAAESAETVGYVQATVKQTGKALEAECAWVIGAQHQGQGIATEAASGMLMWLTAHEVASVSCAISPNNRASEKVANNLGFSVTDKESDGERIWTRTL